LRISGLIDYGDAMIGFHEYDFLVPCTFLAGGDRDLLTSFFTGYGYRPEEISGALATRLMTMLLLHRYSNLDVQIQIPGWRDLKSLSSLEALIWPRVG
jgi:hygromycin-B 7''-O-kinase